MFVNQPKLVQGKCWLIDDSADYTDLQDVSYHNFVVQFVHIAPLRNNLSVVFVLLLDSFPWYCKLYYSVSLSCQVWNDDVIAMSCLVMCSVM